MKLQAGCCVDQINSVLIAEWIITILAILVITVYLPYAIYRELKEKK